VAKNVLFVGSFISKSTTGHVGGQMFACNSLINSNLNQEINFILLDTTASTNKKRSIGERAFGGVKRIIRFMWFLMTKKIDTVMVFCSNGYSFKEKGMMIMLAKSLNKKTIIAPRSGFLIDDIESSPSFKNYAAKVFKNADHIICQGNFWKTFFKEQFEINEAKLSIIHNWIPVLPKAKRALDSKKIKVLFLGWIERNKGIYDILKAAEMLKDHPIEWIIGGNGSEFENVEQWISDKNLKDKVKLKGWILDEDKTILFNTAHLFILPSYREGLPNALLEAMQAGLAVITTKVGGIPDVVQHDVNGYLIEPGNYKELASYVRDLSKDVEKIKSLGANAIKTIENQHSIDIAISKFREILT
jgi:glycosyltransferase involved in cell wall biosynthesis